jgi:hypothetical protein
MKKTVIIATLFLFGAALFTACGDGGAAEAEAAALKEAARQDSLAKVIEESEAALKAKEAELQKAYEELKALHETQSK